MKNSTKKRRKAIKNIEEAFGRQEINNRLFQIYSQGKAGFDALMKDMGKMMAETIMYMDREEVAGPDYHPNSPDIKKWASQGGSVFIGDQKIRVEHPRLRGTNGEIILKSYGSRELLVLERKR